MTPAGKMSGGLLVKAYGVYKKKINKEMIRCYNNNKILHLLGTIKLKLTSLLFNC